MASIAIHSADTLATPSEDEVSLFRLYLLRAGYLLLIVGLGGLIVPQIVSHPITDRGVIAALLGAIWTLALVGLRHPLRMLPLLLFEFAWKLIWMIFYGLPQYSAGRFPATFAEDFFNIGFGVILMPLLIPWGHVWRRYVRQPGARWTRTAAKAGQSYQ
jgi:hypothetical protein